MALARWAWAGAAMGASGTEQNLLKLLRDGAGSVVSIPEAIENVSKQPQFAGKVHVSDTPYVSKSYFLGFSKKTPITEEERQRVWEQIMKVREARLSEFAQRYQ